MKKFFLLLITLALAAPIFAQESSQEVAPSHSRHNISVEYGILNISDFAWAVASAFRNIFDSEEDEDIFLPGDIGINYGYEVGNLFETGIIFNFAIPDGKTPFFTFMPRAKLNFNQGGFFNPYMELDAGITAFPDDITPMIHWTVIGFEIGYFYTQLLGFGQRGLLYAGVKIPL